jgi:hypothetical protein
MLAQEESRIFEELLSRFDSLGDEQMLKVGVTPEWSAKDLLVDADGMHLRHAAENKDQDTFRILTGVI